MPCPPPPGRPSEAPIPEANPPALVLGHRHRAVGAAAALHRPRVRRAQGRFLVEGPPAVAEALAAGVVDELFVAPAFRARAERLLGRSGHAGVAVRYVDASALAALTSTVTPQGIVAVARMEPVPPVAALAGPPRLGVLLAGVSDPGNAGSVLRSADAVGAEIFATDRGTVDLYGSKCVRSSAGSLFHLPVCTAVDSLEFLGLVGDRGVRTLFADVHGESDLVDLDRSGVLSEPTMWVFGNEARGLDPRLASVAGARVRVPMYGAAESLNLAAAAAICLYASARAQRSGPPDHREPPSTPPAPAPVAARAGSR